MARAPVDLRTPGGRGVWVDRSPARRLSSPDEGPRAPAVWAPGNGPLWAWYEDAPSPEAFPTLAPTDRVLPQGWRCGPEDTTHAFGSRFASMVVRILRALRTSEGPV